MLSDEVTKLTDTVIIKAAFVSAQMLDKRIRSRFSELIADSVSVLLVLFPKSPNMFESWDWPRFVHRNEFLC